MAQDRSNLPIDSLDIGTKENVIDKSLVDQTPKFKPIWKTAYDLFIEQGGIIDKEPQNYLDQKKGNDFLIDYCYCKHHRYDHVSGRCEVCPCRRFLP